MQFVSLLPPVRCYPHSSQTFLRPSRNFLPPLPRKLHYWHLMMRSFLMISLPLLRPPHRAEVAASDAFVVAVDAEVAADFCDTAAFVSDVFAAPALVAAALFEDSAAAALFDASVAFVDAVPALEDAD